MLDLNKTKNSLGLAKKAGAVTAGTELVIDAVRKKKAAHVFICSDASAQTMKKLLDKTDFYRVPVTKLDLTMSELARCVGLTRPTAAVSLTNKNFLKLFNFCDLSDLSGESGKSAEVHL
ncbi:MAG: ribosomal L7Ae/L30e/S12e/Gadd45 family protein [Oscillospiraceae bacterium]|nr:ribosomal L7Ae/L30e/S12e/Gadd45 family protein [Oscillospiraceae bacterium]